MKLKIKEVADLVGISVRTLHHYDEIGLLKPEEITESGYRLYSDKNLETLQQVMFFKELDFPLKEIKEIINNPTFDRHEALQIHRKMLLKKRRRIDKMIRTIDKTTQNIKGDIPMSNKEKFEGFDFSHNPYEKEARERWGDDTIDKSNAKLVNMSKTEQTLMSDKVKEIFQKLADLRETSPSANKVQNVIKEWYDFLNSNTGHHYSLDAFKGLGEMYVDDERFTKNIDQFGNGLARFMRDAMGVYAEKNKK
ncbi:MerR family transcriptional regulator [Virgibacillus sp. W0181]|uniref:MerR family transcriptional regulator n=1 Tax=Virgibacillus sp. W0181 TaxID=3391581 RepID=UPI003F470623